MQDRVLASRKDGRPQEAITPVVARASRTALVLRHLPSLDLLRGAAILMVVFFHLYGGVQWSEYFGNFVGALIGAAVGECNFGVQLFFLLSGFLITNILLRSRHKRSFYRDFYIKRVLRILPLYAVMLVVLKIWLPVTWGFFAASCLFLANFARLFGASLNQYGPLWSLCVEEHFYLLWPTCVRRFDPRKLTSILLWIIIVEPLLRFVAITHNAAIDIRFKTPFILDYIAYGALLATLIHRGTLHSHNVRKVGYALLAIGTPLVLFTLVLTAVHDTVGLIALRPVPWMWVCTGLLLLGLNRDSQSASQKQRHGVLWFFASISYGLYLIDPFVNEKLYPVLAPVLIRHGINNFFFATVFLLFSGGIATLIAFLSSRFFERPINNLKARLVSYPAPHGDGSINAPLAADIPLTLAVDATESSDSLK